MKSISFATVILGFSVTLACQSFAWDGTETETGNQVTIESGNLVREGQDIQVYDYGRGEYRDMTVGSINSFGSSVEVEVTDMSTGETTTLDMERE